MDPNTRPTQPTEEPLADAIPDAKEPDTDIAMSAAPSPVNDVASETTMIPTESIAPLPPSPTTTPLPSDTNVVTPTTPIMTMDAAISGTPVKKNKRIVLIVILAVVILVAAVLIFYVTTV